MPGFYQPWMLLYLAERAGHGYELLARLRANKDTRGVDPAALYRTLRQFEAQGLVRSSWDVERAGPARRVYELTSTGLQYMRGWQRHVQAARRRLDRILKAYQDRAPRKAAPMADKTRSG